MKLELIEKYTENPQRLRISQAKLTAKQIYEWGNEPCAHRDNDFPEPKHVPEILQIKKRWCDDCWKELLETSR